MTDNPWEDPGWLEYAEHAINELVPKMARLGDHHVAGARRQETRADMKYALELGLSIMLDKPIIAVVTPGTQIPAKLMQVADEIMEGTWTTPTSSSG